MITISELELKRQITGAVQIGLLYGMIIGALVASIIFISMYLIWGAK